MAKGLVRAAPSQAKSAGGGQATRRTVKYDDKRSKFSRIEFTVALVNIAIRKYCDTKRTGGQQRSALNRGLPSPYIHLAHPSPRVHVCVRALPPDLRSRSC